MEPPLAEAISGLKRSMTAKRSSTVMPCAPPVVMPMTTLLFFLIPVRIFSKVSKSAVGWPVTSRRAWMCTMDAPAAAASRAFCVTSSAPLGRYGVMVGVWIPPVTAAVTMIFFCFAIMYLLNPLCFQRPIY